MALVVVVVVGLGILAVVVLYAALSASVASWASLSHTPPAGLRAIGVPASVPLSDVHVPTAVSVPTRIG